YRPKHNAPASEELVAGMFIQYPDDAGQLCIIGQGAPFSSMVQASETPKALALDPNGFTNGDPLRLNTVLLHFSRGSVHSRNIARMPLFYNRPGHGHGDWP
ncbi:MAG TPA: hypothetical protein VGV18_00055, partial [Verrucomicrobiae bacterium]|nr:hypothetical protein [Verrucomicrobiae bacterium]